MTVATELAEYVCHKHVHAGKIENIFQGVKEFDGGTWLLYVDDGTGKTVEKEVTHAWFLKHTPQVGGYFVTYADGYESYSPAEAFDEGYTRIEP